MRKIIFITTLVLLAASAGAYLYFFQPFTAQKAMETVLPGDTLGMVRACGLKKQIERFKAGRLGQALAGIDAVRLMEAMELSTEQRQEVMQGLENLKIITNSAWFDVLFGQDIALALLNGDFDPQRWEAGDFQSLLDSVVIVARPKQPARVLESLTAIFDTQLSLTTQKYRQWEIYRLDLRDGQDLYYTLNQGLMVAGFSIAPLQHCLDQSATPISSLAQTPAYRRYGTDLFKPGQTELLIFVNAQQSLLQLQEAIQRLDENEAAVLRLNAQLEQLQGIDSIHLAQYDNGDPLVRWKMIVGLDRTRMTPVLKHATGIAPTANPTLSQVPTEALLYSWQNTVDLQFYWQQIRQNPDMAPEILARIQNTVAEQTGMPLESLLKAFGTQAGLLINSFNLNGMFPVPELVVFIEAVQPDIIEDIISRQIVQLNLPLRHETYAGAELHYTTLPLGAALSPAYTFSDGFFTLAINRVVLKKMLDAPTKGHLTANPKFGALNQGLEDKNNSIFYLDAEDLFSTAREIIARSIAWMAMAKPDGIEKARAVVELGINPLLDGLGMLRAVGGRTRMAEDRIESDIFALLDRP